MFCLVSLQKSLFDSRSTTKKSKEIYSGWFMCAQNAEVNSHLFLQYKTAANLWNMFVCILGVSWVAPKTTKGMLRLLDRDRKRRNGGRLVGTDSASIWWTL